MRKSINFTTLPVRVVVSDVKYKSYHYHPDVIEMLFVLEGKLSVTANQRSTFVDQGEFLLINEGKAHSIHSDRICTVVSLYLDVGHYTQMLPHLRGVRFACTRAELAPEQVSYWEILRNYFIRLMLMHNKNTPPAQGIMKDLADKIVGLLWLRFQARKDLAPNSLERYYSINSYLKEHYNSDLSVTQVAAHEGISVTRLAHFWKDATGKSIRQTLTKYRLEDAEKMLLETPLTVNEIAYRCGFSDEKYFYQHFKAHYKATPNEYRIRNLENQEQTVRVLLSRRESEQQVAAFAMKYYMVGLGYGLPGLSEEECKKEAVLDHLYDAILRNSFMFRPQFEATKQDTGYMQIAPDKALFLRDGLYHINWEYVYAQMHVFLDYGFTINMLVDFDCMSLENWRPLLSELVNELLSIWGKRVVEAQHYRITSKAIPMYRQCLALAEYLRKNTPIQDAHAMFLL